VRGVNGFGRQAQGMLQWPHSGFHVHAGEAPVAIVMRIVAVITEPGVITRILAHRV
jgi:hypothetical protein